MTKISKYDTLEEMIKDLSSQGIKVNIIKREGSQMQMTNMEMGSRLDILLDLKEEGKLGYAIARNMRKLKDASQEYLDKRYELLTKYDLITEEGKLNVDNKDGMRKYAEEMGDIPQIKHDVDIFQVTEDEFCSGSLTSDQMSELLWMVKEEEEDDG